MDPEPSTSSGTSSKVPPSMSDERLNSTDQEKYRPFESLMSSDSSDNDADVITHLPDTTENNEKRSSTSNNEITDILSIDVDFEEIVLALIWQNGYLGAAYYNTTTSELYTLEDITESNLNFNLTNIIYRQCRPSIVITLTGMTDQFLSNLKNLIIQEEQILPDETPRRSERRTRSKLKILSKKENNYTSCSTRVRFLKLETEAADFTNDERVIFLNSIINFNNSVMIYALGLLLRYLDRNWNVMALEAIGQPKFMQLHKINVYDETHVYLCIGIVVIQEIRRSNDSHFFDRNNIVMIDNDSYKALQIINPKHHPSSFKFGDARSCKEGLSLFSILNRCRCRPGSQYLWSMVQRPTNDTQVLNERLDTIQFCLDQKNHHIVENIKLSLSKVYQITKVMNRLSAPQAKSSEWRRLHKTLCNVIHIADVCKTCKDALPLFGKIVECTTEEMHHLQYFIEYIVDFESCKQQNKFVVKPGVDAELDQLNHINQTLPQILTAMCRREIRNLPASVKACNMIYLPDIGYLLAITEWEGEVPLDYELPGLKFKFIANNICHYKSPAALELDNTVGDIFEKITNRQSQIMLRLVQYINKHIQPVLNIIHHIGELDALISLSVVAHNFNYVRPTITKSQVIDIKQGRHPLLELLQANYFIPNDMSSGEGKSLLKIITGPNASGKSVYLKQIGVIVFMAHIGSYVPADSATIGVLSHIFTRIHFADTISLNASSFMVDLRQINAAVRNATANSLVIIDEFGKGTTETDALALLAATLTDFIQRDSSCPHLLVSTHIHEIINLIPRSSITQHQTFEFMLNEDGSIVFLYQITDGSSGKSFSHAVAAHAGLDKGIVQRAQSLFEDKVKNVESSRLSTLDICYREEFCKNLFENLLTMDEEQLTLDFEAIQHMVIKIMTTPSPYNPSDCQLNANSSTTEHKNLTSRHLNARLD